MSKALLKKGINLRENWRLKLQNAVHTRKNFFPQKDREMFQIQLFHRLMQIGFNILDDANSTEVLTKNCAHWLKDTKGPLHEAADKGCFDIFNLYCKKSKNSINYPCLGYLDIVEILIKNGIDINLTNSHGATALQAAASKGCFLNSS